MTARRQAALLRAEAYERLAQAERLDAGEPDGVPTPAESAPRKRRIKPLPRPIGPVDDLARAAARRDLLRLGVR